MAQQVWRDGCGHANGNEEFATIEEARLTATQWLWIYTNVRPSMALGGVTPAMKLKKASKLKPSTAGSY